MALRNYALLSSAVLLTMAVGCTDSKDDSAQSELALVNDIQCNIGRGAFVAKSEANAAGELKITCPGTVNVAFNGQPIKGQSAAFNATPHEGVNLIHVETVAENGTTKANDIAFLFGTFADARKVTNKAVAVRIGANGMTAPGAPRLPLPAGPTVVTLSQIGTQVLRDQGNLLGRLDGLHRDVGGAGFGAGVTLVHSSYNPKSATIRLSARDGGLKLEADIANITSNLEWYASAPLGIEVGDTLNARIDNLHVTADVNLVFDPATKSLRPTIGEHQMHVEGLDLDSADLSRIPFGIGDGIEDAIAWGAELLINNLGDNLVDLVKDSVLPDLSVSLQQFHLPPKLDVPFLGGQVELKEDFDGASFRSSGLELSAAAAVLAPANAKKNLAAPGWLTQPAGNAAWEQSKSYGVSLSLDYVNQAFFSVWKQGLLNRQLVDHVDMLGIKTGPIVTDMKLPPVLQPSPEGNGVVINLGELQLNTVFHSQNAGDARVRLAVSLVTRAKISLEDNGATLKVMPGGHEASTLLSARIIGVEPGREAAAAELEGILNLFTPYLQTLISNDIDLPPVAIPSVDLGVISPGFAGRDGRFDGALHFDPQAARIVLEGDLVAR